MITSNTFDTDASDDQGILVKGDILIVDDVPENLDFLSTALSQEGYKVRSVLDGPKALKVAKAAQPDLILLDIMMPKMDGYQVCNVLKADPQTRDIPVIFLSALDQTLDKVQAFAVGGIDYIPKPFQVEELYARVENQLSLRAAKTEVLKLNSELEQRVIQRTAQLEREIAERLRIKERLLHVALHEPLSDLPNRTFLLEKLGHLLNPTTKQSSKDFVLMLIAGTNLELINNTLGHNACDQLLVSMARRLESSIDQSTLLAQVDRDTFALVFENFVLEDAIEKTQQFQRELSSPFQLGEHPILVKSSIGMVQAPQAYQLPEHLLRDANTALTQAKEQGRSQVFDAEMHQRTLTFFEIQNDLNSAIEEQQLELLYQPIIALQSGKICGVEALCRWNHPRRGPISPLDFIPVAEETGLIIALDRYVLHQACYQLKDWQNQKLLDPEFRLHINFSAQQFSELDWVECLDNILIEMQVDSQNLAIEITEDTLMKKDGIAARSLSQLKDRNLQVSIDDFGTGYSSLSYLQYLKVGSLKIDRSFINQLKDSQENLEIVCAIVSLAHILNMTVIAEGIETVEQLEVLKELGCEFGQGYLFSRPLASQLATEAIASQCQ